MAIVRNDQHAGNQCKNVSADGGDNQQHAYRQQLLIHLAVPLPKMDEQERQQIEHQEGRQQSHSQHKVVCHILFEEIQAADHNDAKGRDRRIDGHGVFQRALFFDQRKAGHRRENIAGNDKCQKQDAAQAHSPRDRLRLEKRRPHPMQKDELDYPLHRERRRQDQRRYGHLTRDEAVSGQGKQKREHPGHTGREAQFFVLLRLFQLLTLQLP